MKTAWMNISILVILSLAIPMSAAAEFYRYEDRHGNVIYTDDISKVPVNERQQAKMYDDSQSTPAQEPADAQADGKKTPPSAKDHGAIQKEGMRLQAVQKKLNQEYDDLAKENAALKAEQQEAVTPEQIKAVNKKVVSFNARFNAYKEKESAYSSELESYNQRVRDAETEKAQNK